MAWAAIGWNYKSPIYFVSYEGEGKGFTQEKYAKEILAGPIKEIFEQPGDFFRKVTLSQFGRVHP
jgi:hypothetical protein